MEKIIETLSPIERKILPFLHLSFSEMQEKTGEDTTTLLRALKFLESKKVIELEISKVKRIDLGVNGIYYKKNHLPERRLLLTLEKNNYLTFKEAESMSKLSNNEFKVSLGALKKKGLITISNGKLVLSTEKERIIKKFSEEEFIESLPLMEGNLTKEQKDVLNLLSSRKDIIEIKEETEVNFKLTELGKKIVSGHKDINLIEEVTPELIKNWSKNKKFRRYDLVAQVPRIYGGKKHFINQTVEYAKRVWTDMGFKEMTGPIVETSFWNFDALFTAQDHPVREMQDTFFIKGTTGKIKENVLAEKIKKIHEEMTGSKWSEEETKKVVMRTHTTSLSARTLFSFKKENLPAKYFAIGKAFRNETIDWSHGIEFYQSEGIVIDKNVNFRHLLGFLHEFYKKMGFSKIRFRPSFFPYTEPSVEIEVFHPEKKIWLELGGAGMFRPEVTIPLLGEDIPVLAWGQGLDRISMDFYKIKDLRELYNNNIQNLREKKIWIK